MTPYLHSYLVDIRGGRAIRRESTPLGGGDALADKYVVQLMDGTQSVSLAGATVTADVLRPDGKTVSVVGQVVDGAAVVTLDKYCYAVYGELTISIRAIAGDVAQTLLCVRAMVTKASTDIVVDNGLIGNLTELIQAIIAGGGGSGGAATAWYVTLNEDGTADKTFAEIAAAHEAGNIVMCRMAVEALPVIMSLNAYMPEMAMIFAGYVEGRHLMAVFMADGTTNFQMTETPTELPNPYILIFRQGGKTVATYRGDEVATVELPTALPNPNALIFTGAVSATYDGSGAVTVEIPRGGEVTLTPHFANSVEECEDTSLVYVLPDGYIYAYMETTLDQPEIIIEAKANGYWYGNSYNPTGLWQDSTSNMSGKRTNIIPVTPGDQFSYRGYGSSTPDSVVWLDENQLFLSDEKHDARATPVIVTVPEGAAYCWFNSFEYTSSVDGVVLDVKWVLCQASSKQYQWANTGHAFIPADYEDRIIALEDAVDELQSVAPGAGVSDVLAGKKIVYDGDSIAESRLASNANGGGYAKLIADLTGGEYVNQAVGGARLTSDSSRHSVVDNLTNLPTDGALYCFEGGINDFWGNVPVGEITSGYTDAVDPTTICGAMETIFRHCLDNLVGKPVCFVITHKVQNTATRANGNGDTFTDYHDAMVKACRKYSIPYYDAFLESGLNGWNTVQSNAFLTANSSGTGDGIHPNAEGYMRYYVPQLMALFRAMVAVA